LIIQQTLENFAKIGKHASYFCHPLEVEQSLRWDCVES